MYIETSSPRQEGDKARLNSPKMQFSGRMCLSFYYHMYGASMGALNVYINGETIFAANGNKGDMWLKADVDVNLRGTYSVKIFMPRAVPSKTRLRYKTIIAFVRPVRIHPITETLLE